jgi:hypothetical protein
MNIILDPKQVEEMSKKFTVLELDTFKIPPENKTITAYCVVENIPIMEMPLINSKKDLHKNLMINYRQKDWNYCEQALEHLVGSWNKELDSFYEEIALRITKYKEQDPGDAWNGIIEKHTA